MYRQIRPHDLAAVAVVAVALAGCGATAPPPPAAPGPPADVVLLIDVDRHGAILLAGLDREYRGVRRDGTVAWRAPVDPHGPDPVGCLATCPDAILSGSTAAANSTDTADPQPQFVVDGDRRAVGSPAGHKRRILAAAGTDDYVLVGDAWLEVHSHGAVAARLPMPAFGTTWQESADGATALAITATAAGNDARWFAGWRPTGPAARVPGVSSCVAPDGRLAMLVGQPPALLDRAGHLRSVTDLHHAGACAWSATGVIVAEYTVGLHGLRTRLRLLDSAGAVQWGHDLAGEAVVTADPGSSRAAYVAGDIMVELDRSGPTRTMGGVCSARYDDTGGLVIARPDATVTWLSDVD